MKGTRGHVPPGAHMERKESSAFSTGPVHCMRHALPGQQAGRLAHPGPHGMHARREWPMDVRTVQCMRGTLPQPPRPLHRSDACMIHLATFGVRSHRTVYGVPYPQTTTTYVRIPFKRREREREERAVLSHCVRVAWYFGRFRIYCTCSRRRHGRWLERRIKH